MAAYPVSAAIVHVPTIMIRSLRIPVALSLATLLWGCMSPEPKPAEAPIPVDTQAIWANAIRHKIRSNLVIPAGTPPGVKAVFTIVQQPTGKVVSASLRSSSGYPAYDRAARRAILKSSPLPRPEDPKDFVKSISLTFTP